MHVKSLDDGGFSISTVKLDKYTLRPSKFNYPPNPRSFSTLYCTRLIIIFSILLYLIDLSSDIVTGLILIFSPENMPYGIIRLVIILIPVILLTI